MRVRVLVHVAAVLTGWLAADLIWPRLAPKPAFRVPPPELRAWPDGETLVLRLEARR